MDNTRQIIDLYLAGKDIQEIADILRISEFEISRFLEDNIDKIKLQHEKESAGVFDPDKSISTKDTLKSLHEQTIKIIEEARSNKQYKLALNAIAEAREQTNITMKSKGEFDSNKLKENLIPDDFVEFLVQQLDRLKLLEKFVNEDLNLNIENSELINELVTDIQTGVEEDIHDNGNITKKNDTI